jgi:trk system potassium uptake protein TrkA
VLQADDAVYVAATSGTVGEAVALAAKAPTSEEQS